MRITQRELRKIIREELSRTAAPVSEAPVGARDPAMTAHYGAMERRRGEVKRLQRTSPLSTILHIEAGSSAMGESFFFNLYDDSGFAQSLPVPQWFTRAFTTHEPDPSGQPLDVYDKLIAWCRRRGITSVTTDFFHEMGFPIEDGEIINLASLYNLVADAGEEPTLQDM